MFKRLNFVSFCRHIRYICVIRTLAVTRRGLFWTFSFVNHRGRHRNTLRSFISYYVISSILVSEKSQINKYILLIVDPMNFIFFFFFLLDLNVFTIIISFQGIIRIGFKPSIQRNAHPKDFIISINFDVILTYI